MSSKVKTLITSEIEAELEVNQNLAPIKISNTTSLFVKG